MKVEEEFQDVLQNIEFAIVTEFRRDRSILDMNVLDVVNTLARRYEAEDEGRTPSSPRLTELSQRVYNATWKACEYRLGRNHPGSPWPDDELPEPIALTDMVACLKRLRKSIKRWNKVGGRQGYLNFVQQYIV